MVTSCFQCFLCQVTATEREGDTFLAHITETTKTFLLCITQKTKSFIYFGTLDFICRYVTSRCCQGGYDSNNGFILFCALPFTFYLFVWLLSFILVQWLTPSPRRTTMSYVNRGFRDERRVICDVWCVRCLNTLNTALATVTLCYNHTALWQFITLGNLITGIRHTPTAEIQMDKITNV